MTTTHAIRIPIITVDNAYRSVFATIQLSLNDSNGMAISERQSAENFRHRVSLAGYKSDWHVAGDPTLIIVQQGQIALTLRNQQVQHFSAGEQFIAADFLPATQSLNEQQGHRAQIIGTTTFHAVHIKLSTNPMNWLEQNGKAIIL